MPRDLLFSLGKKDFTISYFSGTGAGGQHRNRHMNCVRIKHPESGATGTGQSSRSRSDNTKEAFNNLLTNPKFKVWHNRKVNEVIAQKTLEETVDDLMKPENLKIEAKENGKWEDV